MEINLLLPNSDDNLTKKTSISTSISLWSSLSSTLSISPSDAIKVYSAVRKEASFQKYLVPPNQLDELIRSDSKNVKLFNMVHTILSKNTKIIYFNKRGFINLNVISKTIRNDKGQFISNPRYDYQKITIFWGEKIRNTINKTVIKEINSKKVVRLSFNKCESYQLVIHLLNDKKMLKLVSVCKARSSLDNEILANWLANMTNNTKDEISALIKSYDAEKLYKPSNASSQDKSVLPQEKLASAQHFGFKHDVYNVLVLGDMVNLYWFSCSDLALSEISRGVNSRRGMKLTKNTDSQYEMNEHIFTLVSSTVNVLVNELSIASRTPDNYPPS
ncbi:MAG: hypothetical protein V7690_02710 [Shewanella sp.]|uniref:hypothetical protein n=1 Tax=Shewanella sp. TaxID=50422 RepID=UPI003002E210